MIFAGADIGFFLDGGDFGNPSERASIAAVWAYGRMKFERLCVRTWAWLEMYKSI